MPADSRDDAYLADLLAQLRAIDDPMRRLEACRRAIDRHNEAARDARDERDALVYAGSDYFSQPGRAPGAWRGAGPWRKTLMEVTGLSSNLVARIAERRRPSPDSADPDSYWRAVGRGGQLLRLPDVSVDPDPQRHWARARDADRRADAHQKIIDVLSSQIRIPTLQELMVVEPSNVALEGPSGLTMKRIEQIRAKARAGGLLPAQPRRGSGDPGDPGRALAM